MNKVAISAVIVVIIALGGGYAVYRNASMPKNETEIQNVNTAGNENAVTKNSFKGLLAAGKSVKCSYTQTIDSGTQSGTTYIAGGRMRGDITTGSYTMHMINDGEWNYTWGGPMGDAQGVKMKMMAAANANSNAQARQNVDLDQQLDFSCVPWNADNDMFALPSGVVFNDLSNLGGMMQVNTNVNGSAGAVNGNVNVNEDGSAQAKIDCSICDKVPAGDAREQCLQALKC